jgi:hypothetical protein
MPTTVKQTLTGTQFAAITDFTDLWLEFKANRALYQGPGNVISGAASWCGLRAYMLSTVGSNVIRLRRDSDNAEADFVTITGGGLDSTSITSFKGAANLFCTKAYDQSGHSADLAQASAALQPAFNLTGGPSSGPTLVFSGAQCLVSPTFTQLPDFTIVAASRVTDANTDFLVCGATNLNGVLYASGNLMFNAISATASAGASIVQNTYYASIHVFTGASGNTIDANDPNFGSSGTNGGGYSSEQVIIGARTTAANLQPFTGNLQEFGIWPSAFAGANYADMTNNLRSFYGF